eukprot:5708780-Pleurochrysis_carterae.AAC.8
MEKASKEQDGKGFRGAGWKRIGRSRMEKDLEEQDGKGFGGAGWKRIWRSRVEKALEEQAVDCESNLRSASRTSTRGFFSFIDERASTLQFSETK